MRSGENTDVSTSSTSSSSAAADRLVARRRRGRRRRTPPPTGRGRARCALLLEVAAGRCAARRPAPWRTVTTKSLADEHVDLAGLDGVLLVDVPERLEDEEQRVVVALELGPLVGVDGVLDGQRVQVEGRAIARARRGWGRGCRPRRSRPGRTAPARARGSGRPRAQWHPLAPVVQRVVDDHRPRLAPLASGACQPSSSSDTAARRPTPPASSPVGARRPPRRRRGEAGRRGRRAPCESYACEPLPHRDRLLHPGVVEVDAGQPAGEDSGGVGRRAAVSNKDDGGHSPEVSGASLGLVIVDNALYHRGKRVPLGDGDDQSLGHARVPCDPGDFQWIGIHDPSPDELDADRHAPSACTRWPSRTPSTPTSGPSSSATATALFLVLKTLWYVDEDDAVETGEINMFVGRDYVVTVRHGQGIDAAPEPRCDLEERTRRPRRTARRRSCTPSATRSSTTTRRSRRRWRRTSTRSRRRSSPPPAPTTPAGSTSSSARSPRCAARSCRCASRCGSSPTPAVPTIRTRIPRRRPRPFFRDVADHLAAGRGGRSTASTACCRPRSTATWPASRSSRTRTCARSPPAPPSSSCRP